MRWVLLAPTATSARRQSSEEDIGIGIDYYVYLFGPAARRAPFSLSSFLKGLSPMHLRNIRCVRNSRQALIEPLPNTVV